MTKIVSIDNKYTWKITTYKDPIVGILYNGNCGRLGLTVSGALTLDQLVDLAQTAMYNLFKDQYEHGNLNDFAFKNSATFRIKDLEEFLDLNVPLIIEDQ